MQTKINEYYINTPLGKQADEILRRCVHCGFCNATCPTYQILGDELDGPRGRIYQIKQVLETQQASAKIQLHLDRCLTCLSCESTCPSGVKYGQLLDIGRQLVDDKIKRSLRVRMMRAVVVTIVPHLYRVKYLFSGLSWFKWILPKFVCVYLPTREPNRRPTRESTREPNRRPNRKPTKTQNRQANKEPNKHHDKEPEQQKRITSGTDSGTDSGAHSGSEAHPRKMLLLQGCVQPAFAPEINAALTGLLDYMGISVIPTKLAGCCGALSHHLSKHNHAQNFMRANIDAWWQHIESGAESIITTASACSLFIKDYERLLANDTQYASKAKRISAMCQDVSEVLSHEDLPFKNNQYHGKNIAFHAPCTLQHGLGIKGNVETLLQHMGLNVLPVRDAHLCCGAAGTYSIFQKGLSDTLRSNKLQALQSAKPDIIATANIGCLLQLRAASNVPVKHWVELLVG